MTGRLEEQPLDKRGLLLIVSDREPLFGVVLVDQVEQDRVTLPDCVVAVVVVDQRGDAAIGVVLRVRGSLMLSFREVEKDGLVGKAEFLQDEGNFPTATPTSAELAGRGDVGHLSNEPAVRTTSVSVKRKLLSVRHLRMRTEEMSRETGLACRYLCNTASEYTRASAKGLVISEHICAMLTDVEISHGMQSC